MKKKLISLLLIICLMIPSFTVFAEDTVDLEKIDELIRKIETFYKFDVTREQLIEGAYKGIVEQLDRHSKYFSEEEFDQFLYDLDGSLIGIGIYIEEDSRGIKIISPIVGSPADNIGIQSGDIITHVDNLDVTTVPYEEATDKIIGEAGTSVKITVYRDGSILNFDIVREVIKIPDVLYEMLDDNIGYIRIIRFGTGVSDEFSKAVQDLKTKNMSSIVLDLRNNPGGYLDEVVEIADWFIDEDENIAFVDYTGRIDRDYNGKTSALDIPLAVLVNNGSASASEILAGAIKYNSKGTIIGETTYGKGTVQSLYQLATDGAIKVTTAEYFSANKQKVNGVGVEPDIYLPLKTKEELLIIEGFAPMIDKEISHYGITSLDVFGAQQRFKFLGYDVDLTGTYDQKTSQAIIAFQEAYNLANMYALYPETKDKLNELIVLYLNEDPQLGKAIEVLTTK